MKLRKTLHTKGYTMIELIVTLFIFATICLLAVPAFFTFIEKSRAKSQITQAANFLRSAQEIAIANNRIVYVYTEGLMTYQTDTPADRSEYWTKDWVMSFKPMGMTYITVEEQIKELTTNSSNHLIAQQRIFSKSNKNNKYVLSIIDSENHNNILLQSANTPKTGAKFGDMEGYGKVKNPTYQGLVKGAPTFIAFYPSGEASLPIFIVSERTKTKDSIALTDTAPFTYDHTFKFDSTVAGTGIANQWTDTVQANFQEPIAILAGCRTGRSLTVDAINYTFNHEVIKGTYIFDGEANSIKDALSIPTSVGEINYAPPPSFGHYLCGSKFLQ